MAMGEPGCMGCIQGLREEFRVKKLGLGHGDPSLFVKPQCFKPLVYLFWTVLWALFYVSMLMLDVYYNRDTGPEWFIYLTNLSYLVQAVGVAMDCVVTVYVHWRRKDIRDGVTSETTWYIQVLWVLFNVSISSSILVTILYYTLLSPDFSHGSVNKHMLNAVYTVLLLAFAAKPVQLLHFYQSMIFSTLYAIFSAIYQEAGNDPIYDPLDWTKPRGTSVTVVLAVFVGLPVVHVCCYAIYTLRLFIWRKCNYKTVPFTDEQGTTKKTTRPKEQTHTDTASYVNKGYQGP